MRYHYRLYLYQCGSEFVCTIKDTPNGIETQVTAPTLTEVMELAERAIFAHERIMEEKTACPESKG